MSGEAVLLAQAVSKTLFLDVRKAFNAQGMADTEIPAKLEGAAFGPDVMIDGLRRHTLFIANDNDFDGSGANPNRFFVFAFDDADLPGFTPQQIAERPKLPY